MLTLLFWKHGVFNVKPLERAIRSPFRNFSRDSCPKKPKSSKCSLVDESPCLNPDDQPSPGRAAGQVELTFCDPDCLKGVPNLPPRGCLPWEKVSEMCPEKMSAKTLQSQCCEHICEPSIGRGIIDKLKVSVCEYRRFQKCYLKHGKAPECMKVMEVTPLYTQKIYPMIHAGCKKYLPGCPKTSHQFVKPKVKEECEI